jgi:hypothetical protein
LVLRQACGSVAGRMLVGFATGLWQCGRQDVGWFCDRPVAVWQAGCWFCDRPSALRVPLDKQNIISRYSNGDPAKCNGMLPKTTLSARQLFPLTSSGFSHSLHRCYRFTGMWDGPANNLGSSLWRPKVLFSPHCLDRPSVPPVVLFNW